MIVESEPEIPEVPEIKNGIIKEDDGTLAYYINGQKQSNKGLILVDGHLYYVNSSGKVVTGSYWVTKYNEYPEYEGRQNFDEEGRLIVQ